MTQCITKLQSQKKNTCIFVCLFLRHCNLDVFTVKYRILCTFLTVQFAEVEMFPKVLCKFRSFLVKREDFFTLCRSLKIQELSYVPKSKQTSQHLIILEHQPVTTLTRFIKFVLASYTAITSFFYVLTIHAYVTLS